MAAAQAEVKVKELESYVRARNSFFLSLTKWFYSDPTVTEVCGCIL
jgi:hypothetical protein